MKTSDFQLVSDLMVARRELQIKRDAATKDIVEGGLKIYILGRLMGPDFVEAARPHVIKAIDEMADSVNAELQKLGVEVDS